MGLFIWSVLAGAGSPAPIQTASATSVATAIAAAPEPAPEPLPAPIPTYTVAMTAYNAVPGQTDGDPTITASGAYSDPDIIAARSRDLADELPFGTVIEVTAASSSPGCGYRAVGDEIGLRVIGDSMNARMHNKIDILFDSGRTARTLGVCDSVSIRVVGHVAVGDVPHTQEGLRLAVGYLPKADEERLAVSK